MTCICALVEEDYTYMGCDSSISSGNGWGINTISDGKIFYKKPFLIGLSGNPRIYQIIQYKTKFKPIKAGTKYIEYMATDFADSLRSSLKDSGRLEVEKEVEYMMGDTTLLVGLKGYVFSISEGFYAELNEDNFCAIGCGGDFALGSLYSTKKMKSEKRIRLALEAASKYSGAVRGPYCLFRLNNSSDKFEKIL